MADRLTRDDSQAQTPAQNGEPAPPRDPDAAARTAIADVTTPADLAAADRCERWAFAVIRLLETAPDLLATVAPAVAVAAAGRGKVCEAMGIWQRWRLTNDWQRLEAFAAGWAADNASQPRLLRATLDIALATALVDPAAASRLGDLAVAADPRGAGYWMSAWKFQETLALGNNCASLPPDARRLLARFFAGGTAVLGDAATDELIDRLTTMDCGRLILSDLDDANPAVAATFRFHRELRALSVQARERLVTALASGEWRSHHGHVVDEEIIRHLAAVDLPNPLFNEVQHVLPHLLGNVLRMRHALRRAPFVRPDRSAIGVTSQPSWHQPAPVEKPSNNPALFAMVMVLVVALNALRSCPRSGYEPGSSLPPPAIHPVFNTQPMSPVPNYPYVRPLFPSTHQQPFAWPPQPAKPGEPVPLGPPLPR